MRKRKSTEEKGLFRPKERGHFDTGIIERMTQQIMQIYEDRSGAGRGKVIKS